MSTGHTCRDNTKIRSMQQQGADWNPKKLYNSGIYVLTNLEGDDMKSCLVEDTLLSGKDEEAVDEGEDDAEGETIDCCSSFVAVPSSGQRRSTSAAPSSLVTRIYVGDGKVIHFTRGGGHEIGTGTVLDRIIFSSSPSNPSDNPCARCGDQSRADGVISSCLECFLSGGELYLFEYAVSPAFFLAKARGGTCTLARSDPPEDVLHRAEFLLLNGFGGYHIFKNNCEDFAIYCKTGLLVFTSVSVGRSGQAASYLAAASAVVSSPLRFLTTSFSGLAVVNCAIYCVSRFVSDIGVRRDVIRIPVERLVARSGLLDESEAATETAKED
ncbi:unnamed protein product [Ilex paraguariensis]|uniref:LRAT domain-containing protein n=1 Tax=Ilex paraguariensis TaxID=185542 RepID=A0ABC8RC69_9AQUA